MIKELRNLFVIALVFGGYNFFCFSQDTLTFNTVTEAVDYNGNKDSVKKIIITGTISGDDYSEGSEWSKFSTFNKTFPNIEEIEILTDQNIPDYITTRGLFNNINWLKKFSAPNVTSIGDGAFSVCKNLISINFPLATNIGEDAFNICENLVSVNFPVVTTIGDGAFSVCISLTSINFPLATNIGNNAFSKCTKLTSVNFPVVTTIGDGAFSVCVSLTSVNLEADFTQPTTIKLGVNVFLNALTPNIDLVLGENVLPKPNLTAKTWQGYTWKSIIQKTDGIEEIVKNSTVNIFPNPTNSEATVSFELESACNMKILLCDILGIELMNIYDGFADTGTFINKINIGHLSKGIYFIKIQINGNTITKKIILE